MKNYENKKEAWEMWDLVKKQVDVMQEPEFYKIINAKQSNGALDEYKHQLIHYSLDVTAEGIKASKSLVESINVIFSYDRCDKCSKTYNKRFTAYFNPSTGQNMDFNISGESYTRIIA